MSYKTPFGRCATLLGAMALSVFAVGASANTGSDTSVSASMASTDDASQRINLSGKLRMLSQRVTAAACYVRAGVAVDTTLPALLGAADEFDAILNALEHGNDDMGIFGEETRRRTLVGLGKLRDEFWAPVAQEASLIANGAGNGETVALMATQSEPLLEFTKRMVAEISGQYSNPAEIVQADAMLIDVAGRQRMLAQRISKTACLTGTGLGSDAISAQLEGATEMFETSLFALHDGMPAAGIRQPPTEEIAESLAAVIERWNALKPVLASIDQADAESLAIVFTQTTSLTAEMNAIVSLYGEASKQGL